MLGQVGGVGKGLGAVRALVGLGLCVRLGVDLHLGLGEKGQRAYLTPVGKRQVHPGKIPPTRAWIAEGRPSMSERPCTRARALGGGCRVGGYGQAPSLDILPPRHTGSRRGSRLPPHREELPSGPWFLGRGSNTR